MKTSRSLLLLLTLLLTGTFGSTAFGNDGHKHDTADTSVAHRSHLVKVTDKDAAWFAKAKADYPTDVCVVSEDKLGGEMGGPQDYIYREAGKADRLVRFCCKDCLKDFNADPTKFLGMIDAAAKKKAAK
ncbi:MAG: hypothetical protein ABIZ04_07715 [Opitutus sp.]